MDLIYKGVTSNDNYCLTMIIQSPNHNFSKSKLMNTYKLKIVRDESLKILYNQTSVGK